MQETLAAEEKARGPVLDRQGIAINPIAGFELALVVDGPNVVGRGHRARRPAGMRAPSPSRLRIAWAVAGWGSFQSGCRRCNLTRSFLAPQWGRRRRSSQSAATRSRSVACGQANGRRE